MCKCECDEKEKVLLLTNQQNRIENDFNTLYTLRHWTNKDGNAPNETLLDYLIKFSFVTDLIGF